MPTSSNRSRKTIEKLSSKAAGPCLKASTSSAGNSTVWSSLLIVYSESAANMDTQFTGNLGSRGKQFVTPNTGGHIGSPSIGASHITVSLIFSQKLLIMSLM